MKVYVASSWRNAHQPEVVAELRELGCDVYDFRNPPHGRGGFAWSDIDSAWQSWTPSQWRDALTHPLAVEGFKADYAAMEWADVCVCVLPCGRSAHIEAGWFAGCGKPVCWFSLEPVEPDLMVAIGDGVLCSFGELNDWMHDAYCGNLPKQRRLCAGFGSSPWRARRAAARLLTDVKDTFVDTKGLTDETRSRMRSSLLALAARHGLRPDELGLR